MRYNILGTSDLVVSEISFGCMSLGADHIENAHLLHQAMEKGINLFDTADMYEKDLNEITVGKACKGRRKEVIIATKVGNQWRSDGGGWDWNPGKDYILQAVDQSLERLQTDYIDLYQLHGGTINDPIGETIKAFEILKRQGKIRHYGISSIRPNVIREYIERSGIVSVMMQYSPLDRRPEERCLDLLAQHNIGVLARGSLAKGLLVNKPIAPYLNHSAEEVQKAVEIVSSLGSKTRNDTATAIRFVLQHPAVTSAVVGVRTKDQLEASIEAAHSPVLSGEEMQLLRDSLPADQYTEHR